MGNAIGPVPPPNFTIVQDDAHYDVKPSAIPHQAILTFKNTCDKWEKLIITLTPPGLFGLYSGSIVITNFWGGFYLFLPLMRKDSNKAVQLSFDLSKINSDNGLVTINVHDDEGIIGTKSFNVKLKLVISGPHYNWGTMVWSVSISRAGSTYSISSKLKDAKFDFWLEWKHGEEDIKLGIKDKISFNWLTHWEDQLKGVVLYGTSKGFLNHFNDNRRQLAVLENEKKCLEDDYNEAKTALEQADTDALNAIKTILAQIQQLDQTLQMSLYKPRMELNAAKTRLRVQSATYQSQLAQGIATLNTLIDENSAIGKALKAANEAEHKARAARDNAYNIKVTAYNNMESCYHNWQHLIDYPPATIWIPFYGLIKWHNDCNDLKDTYETARGQYSDTCGKYDQAEKSFKEAVAKLEKAKEELAHATADVKKAQGELTSVRNSMDQAMETAIAQLDKTIQEINAVKSSATCMQLKKEREALYAESQPILDQIGKFQALANQISWIAKEIDNLKTPSHVVVMETITLRGTVEDLRHGRLFLESTGTRGGKPYSISGPYILADPAEIFKPGRFKDTREQNICAVFYSLLGMFDIFVSGSAQANIVEKFILPPSLRGNLDIPADSSDSEAESWDSDEFY